MGATTPAAASSARLRPSTSLEIPPGYVPRPALELRLDEATSRRLTTVIAGAGFGKSTLVRQWSRHRPTAWYEVDRLDQSFARFVRGLTQAVQPWLRDWAGSGPELLAIADRVDSDEPAQAEAVAARLCTQLDVSLTCDLVLVVDDVHELPPHGASARLLEALCRQAPPGLHLVFASRVQLPFSVDRARGRGEVLDLDGPALSFTLAEIATLAETVLGSGGRAIAPPLYQLTAGWPAATRLALEMLRTLPADQRHRALDGSPDARERLFGYLAEEVLATESPDTQWLLRVVAPLERFTADLCAALGAARAAETLADLSQRGLLASRDADKPGWYSLHDLLREFVLARWPMTPVETAKVWTGAAGWFETHGQYEESLRALTKAPDADRISQLLAARGSSLLASGAISAVLDAAGAIPDTRRDDAVRLLLGQALQIQGDSSGALECFGQIAGSAATLEPGLAWRMGLIYYERGEPKAALSVYRRGRIVGADTADEAFLLSWMATAYWKLGDTARCRDAAMGAHGAASRAGDLSATAVAHLALALLANLEGDRRANDEHYRLARDAAERAGDVLQLIRIDANHASHLAEEGHPEKALRELERPTELAELIGYSVFLALCLLNRGEVQLQQGRLEEAAAEFHAAVDVYQRMGSRKVAYALTFLGDVYRERGDLTLAHAAYDEALLAAGDVGDVQAVVPALAGLARVVSASDTERATELAARAVDMARGWLRSRALLAAGWVALAAGRRSTAHELAEQACASARAGRDRAALAEGLELSALSAPQPERSREQLEEARGIWRDVGNRLAVARVDLVIAVLIPRRGARLAAARAERTLLRLGVRAHAVRAAGPLSALPSVPPPNVAIAVLGTFEVLRDGTPAAPNEWQSKKARDLVKFVVAHRGRPVPREALMAALWPGEPTERLGNRLSVALATARSVLDPDHCHASDQFLTASAEVVAVDLANVDVDVETFIADAEAGLALLRQGRTADAVELLALAEAQYTGDVLEGNPYEEWAAPMREEARAIYLRVARALVAATLQDGRVDEGLGYCLRILERDPFDETTHLTVVSTLAAAGRHGEARRHYRRYVQRMQELGIEPAAFPR